MEHIAIMKKSWGLTKKILDGRKKIESRWYMAQYPPWNRIKKGERVYFKDSGDSVRLRAEVQRVIQISGLVPQRVREILQQYGEDDGIDQEQMSEFFKRFKDKNYCMLIFLKNPKQVKPFDIDKTGFGAMSAWITVPNIAKIKRSE